MQEERSRLEDDEKWSWSEKWKEQNIPAVAREASSSLQSYEASVVTNTFHRSGDFNLDNGNIHSVCNHKGGTTPLTSCNRSATARADMAPRCQSKEF